MEKQGYKKSGFTLVELIITMAVLLLVIGAASQIFTGLLTQFKQQSSIAETNIEGLIGLEILRQDIEHAGYGLPWNVIGVTDSDGDGNLWDELTNYLEATSIDDCKPNPADFNDASATKPGPPRAILSRNNAIFSGCGANSVFDGSDYLVIKSVNVARNDTSQRWTRLGAGNVKRDELSGSKFEDNDRVIVISPGSSDTNRNALVVAGSWWTTYNNTAPFAPQDTTETRIIYGLDPMDTIGEPYSRRMPFNRADYYIWRNSTDPEKDEVPARCAPNTGILRKTVISQKDGLRQNPLPLLDCVATMQVTFWLDTNGDGKIDWPPRDDIENLTAQEIREQLKEVRVYIVAHEGQRDVTYDFSLNNTRTDLTVIEVNPNNPHDTRSVPLVNLKNQIGDPEYKYYRWKVYTLAVKPYNLR